MGTMDIRIIGTIIPSPKTVMHGTVREDPYLSPMVRTESRATSEASLRSPSLSSLSADSDADMHRRMAFLYPDASSGSLDTSSTSDSEMLPAPLVSVMRTAWENSVLECLGPSSATTRIAVSRDPPEPTAVVIIPTTVGPSSTSLMTSGLIPGPPSCA